MDNISDEDLRVMLRYLNLNIGGTRPILLDRLRTNCMRDKVSQEKFSIISKIERGRDSDSSYESLAPSVDESLLSSRDGSLLSAGDESQSSLPIGPLMRQQSDVLLEHGKDDISSVILFDSMVFIDQYTEMEEGSDDRLCLRIQFPKTIRGKAITRLLVKTYQDILKLDNHRTLIANNIFIPTFYTNSGKLFSCNLNIYDNFYSESLGKKQLRLKTASSMKQALTPNKQGLFKLLDCVLRGCYYLFTRHFNLLSLNLSSILYSDPAKYLVTEFSSEKMILQNYRIHLLRFLDSIKLIHNNFRMQKRKSFIPANKTRNLMQIIDTLLYNPLVSTPVSNLNKTLSEIFEKYITVIYPTIEQIEMESRGG